MDRQEISPEDIKLIDVLETMSDTQQSILLSLKMILLLLQEILSRLDGDIVAEA